MGCGNTVIQAVSPDAATPTDTVTPADTASPVDATTPSDATSPADVVTPVDRPVVDAAGLERFSFRRHEPPRVAATLRGARAASAETSASVRRRQAGSSARHRICAAIAERSMPGSSAKQWRAFLSVTNGRQWDARARND